LGDCPQVSNFYNVKFSELCDITRGASPRPIIEWISPSGIPWVKISDATRSDSRYIKNTAEKIKYEGASRSVEVFPGDLILSNSATPGIPRFMKIYACIHDGWLLLRNFRNIDKDFCYYLLVAERKNIIQQGNGSIFTNLKTEILKNHSVALPPLPEQRAIADVLSALDDKIELNRQMNRTLEQLTQAIYKHMFIDNPERAKWEEKTLDSVCGFEYGKALKEISRVSGIIPVYGSNGLIGFHNEFLVKGPGIVVGRKGNPGIVTFVHTDFFPIDTTFYVVPKNNSSFLWLFFTLSDLNLPNLGADSAVPGLNRNIAYMSLVTVPPQDICYEFENIIKPLFEKIHVNNKESQTLADLRDTLLPKLMSGQVRVKDTAIDLSEQERLNISSCHHKMDH